MTLRVVFMGTPDFAVPTLRAVAAAGHRIGAVYTRAPAASGRGLTPRSSPVQDVAAAAGWPVFTPASLREPAAQPQFAALSPDVAVVVAYGLLLPPAILATPRLGCLNLHASLLPRWRGAAPIQRAVMAGDGATGVAVMRMEAGLDTGPVGASEHVAIGPDATAGELHDILAERGADLMVRALAGLERGELKFTPQPGDGATYASKIGNAEAEIDWGRPAREVHDLVRGLSPWPGAFMTADLGRGRERIKVLRSGLADGEGAPGTLLDMDGLVACGSGAVRLMEVQRGGRGKMPFGDFLRGARVSSGHILA